MSLNNAPDYHWTGEYRLDVARQDDGTPINGGVVLPSVTTAERDALVDVKAGTVVYNSTTEKVNVYTTAWEAVTSA